MIIKAKNHQKTSPEDQRDERYKTLIFELFDEHYDCTAVEQRLHQYRPQLEKLTVIVRMLINHFTLLGALASTSAANQATDSLKSLLSIQNAGGGGALLGAYSGTLSCLFSGDNQTSSSVLNFNMFWIVFASVFVFESIFFFAFTRKLTSTATVALFLSFVAFSPLAQHSSKLLALCKPFDFYNTRDYLMRGEKEALRQHTFRYLSTDLAQECNGDFMESSRVGAALTIGLFCSLLPVVIAYTYKKLAKDEDTRTAIFSFMTKKYKKDAWYYELIVMVRKLVIALVISIFVEQGDLQLQLFTLVTTITLVSSLTIQPLQSKIANLAEQISISSALVCATFLSAISSFHDDKGVAITSTVFIFITQFIAIIAIILFVHRGSDASPKYQQVEEPEAEGRLDAPLLIDSSNDDSELASEQRLVARKGNNRNENDDDSETSVTYWRNRAEEWEKIAQKFGAEQSTVDEMGRENKELKAENQKLVVARQELEDENRLLRQKLEQSEE